MSLRQVRELVVASVLVAGAVAVTGCGEAAEEGRTSPVRPALLVRVALSGADDVATIQFTVQPVDCITGAPNATAIVQSIPLSNQLIPGNTGLANNPLDQGSGHAFADFFQVVPIGCYDVSTLPQKADGTASAVCVGAFKNGVVVSAGQTTEIFLLNQCAGSDPGGVDVISALNHPPVLDDVRFENSKFACGQPSKICMTGHDVDGDPLEFALTAQGCDVVPIGEPSGSPTEGEELCFTVNCHTLGSLSLVATVYDLIWRNGSLVRIEDWLATEGYPNRSHSKLAFPMYVDGVKYYQDNDGDGHGNPAGPIQIVCQGGTPPAGYVISHDDCNDNAPAINPDAPEACDQVDNNCNGEIDEGNVCAPPPGKDIVVFNDINAFDDGAMVNPNNPLLVRNLVAYTTSGPRNAGTVVWMDYGRSSRCGGEGYCGASAMATMYSVIASNGLVVQDVSSTPGSITSIPPEVKVMFLWNPMEAYTVGEINVFKDFAAEGGRLVFVGEWEGYYGSGIALENAFLLNMGAVMTNTGSAIDCGYNDLPASSLRPSQITTDMTGVRIGCSSVIVPGPEDYPLYYDSSNTVVLSGVARVDTTHITVLSGSLITKATVADPTLLPTGPK